MSMITARARDRHPVAVLALRLVSGVHRRIWLTRALTLGVRAIVFDAAGRVLLVRHSYTPGWFFPGGGVGGNESAEAAVVRELREEAALQSTARPVLHGLFRQLAYNKDHVACYIIASFEPIAGAAPDWEIAEAGFFPVDALPPDTTRATRARLDELLHGAPLSETW